MYLALPVSSGRFTRAIRVSSYSRIWTRVVMYFAYGAITLWGAASQQLPLYRRLVTLLVQVRCPHLTTPLSEDRGLGFSRFARRYSGYHESCVPSAQTYCADGTQLQLFSFPPGTEMFHFPGFARHRRYPVRIRSKRMGFPIRKSPDQRLQTASPKHIAG